MKRLADLIILLIYCFTSIFFTSADTAFLTAFLLSAIYLAANYCSGQKILYIVSIVIYTVLVYFLPALLYFFPLVLYILLMHRFYAGIFLPVIMCLLHFLPDSIPLFAYVTTGCLVSLLLSYHTETYEQLHSNYKKTRDDSTELNLLLKEKNQDILKKQDYEIYTATLRERNRIAREIHDNVGHMLSRSILMTGALKTMNRDDSLKGPMIQLEDTLNAAMSSIRESVHDLHDDSVNLKEVLKSLTASFAFCPIVLEYDMGYNVPRDIKYSFITIVKEGLHNISKHSNASSGRILVREHPGLYQLIIEDNGTVSKKPEASGLGLINMQDRVSALYGNIQIRTDKGFCIFITIPKKEN